MKAVEQFPWGMYSLVMILLKAAEEFFSSHFGHQGDIGANYKWSYHVEEIDMVV